MQASYDGSSGVYTPNHCSNDRPVERRWSRVDSNQSIDLLSRSPMEFRLSDDGERFRRKVSEWLQRHLPAGWGTPAFRAPQTMEDEIAFAKSWLRELNEGRWARL